MTLDNLGTEKFNWNLSVFYSDLGDPRLDGDITTLAEMIKTFNLSHKGKLKETLSQAITDLAEIRMLESKISVYLFLKQSLNTGDTQVKAKMAEADRIISTASGEYLSFFDIEVVTLDDVTLEKFYDADPVIAKHRSWLEHIRIFKPHLLTEAVESALTKRSPFGSNAWSELFDELGSDLRFSYNGEAKSLTELLHLLTESKDAEERATIMKLINTGLGGTFAKYSAQTLYITTGSEAVERRERSYANPMTARNKSNRIPDTVVEALHQSFTSLARSFTERFYKLKAAHLGLKILRWSDRNAPMPFTDTTVIPFSDAIKTVLEAYESFSPTLADLIRNTITKQRVDAPVTKGRRGGAFNYSLVLPGNKPTSFTFLNYLGSNRDVATLAHELGHGVHGLLAGEAQGVLMSQAPIAYAETASVFGEKTTFNLLKQRLLKSGDEKSLLALLMSKLDDTINTTVRQMALSNFERRLHGMDKNYTHWGEPTKLSAEEISQIWLETLKEFYGEEGGVFTYENTENLWTYISHFHRPFYVYGYAFGELLTEAIYSQQTRLREKFEPLYLEMLRSGSTKKVGDLVKPFGLDPTVKDFWTKSLNSALGEAITEAEELSRKVGINV